MDQQQSKRAGCGASTGTRAEWTAPLVDKLVAGGAEASAGSDVEGLDGLS
jgi:hypothetical protein